MGRRRISAPIAAAATFGVSLACGARHDTGGAGTRGDSTAEPNLVRPATLTGCVALGYQPGELVLVALGDPGGSSTTAHIAWQGTRQYALVLPSDLAAQARVGQRVIVSGTIVDPPGYGPDRVDQQQMADGMPFREFRASSLQTADGPCRQAVEFGRDAEK